MTLQHVDIVELQTLKRELDRFKDVLSHEQKPSSHAWEGLAFRLRPCWLT